MVIRQLRAKSRNYSDTGQCGLIQSSRMFPRPVDQLDNRLHEAQARERAIEGGRYLQVVTGDREKDFYAVGRMWLEGGG